ncbi:hypothetical protein VTO73DRAFT_13142 [Trametes versicolor]
MSPQALIIHNIVADLLDKEPGLITGHGDIFLLGGNSLLLGRLARVIWKDTGVTVRVPFIFTHCTINRMASLIEGDESGSTSPINPVNSTRTRVTALFTSSMHPPQLHPHHLRAHSQPVLPSQAAQQRVQLAQRQPVALSHSQGYNQPPAHAGYDFFALHHSIDGTARGLMQAHAQMNMHMDTGGDTFNSMASYALSQRPATIPGPLPSPNFSFGNSFTGGSSSSSTSNSASGTTPNGTSPPLLSLRRTRESSMSDGDTEESSGVPLSRFGSNPSIVGSEGSWTRAASDFLGMFSEMDVGSNGGMPAPHGMPEHQLRHTNSNSHLSPGPYATHSAQEQLIPDPWPTNRLQTSRHCGQCVVAPRRSCAGCSRPRTSCAVLRCCAHGGPSLKPSSHSTVGHALQRRQNRVDDFLKPHSSSSTEYPSQRLNSDSIAEGFRPL